MAPQKPVQGLKTARNGWKRLRNGAGEAGWVASWLVTTALSPSGAVWQQPRGANPFPLQRFITQHKTTILNIAGSRESKEPGTYLLEPYDPSRN
jgi:SH3-like domain-containing protein